MHDAEKAAGVCTRFCRVVGEYSDDGKMFLHHNGTGPTTTDSQVVHATPVLGLGKEALAKKLTTWIEGMHAGAKVDLNATMATGGPIWGAPSLVGEWDSELAIVNAIATRGPAMTGWPWRWTDGSAP